MYQIYIHTSWCATKCSHMFLKHVPHYFFNLFYLSGFLIYPLYVTLFKQISLSGQFRGVGFRFSPPQPESSSSSFFLLFSRGQLQSKYNFSDVVIDFHRSKRYSVSTLAEKLGSSVCQALPFFHALTGCDTTSAFKNVGKKTAYEVMVKVLPDIQSTFSTFFFNPFKEITKDSPEFKAIERFVILLYSRTSTHTSVNEAWLDLYFKRTHNLERIPPTADALLLHTKKGNLSNGGLGNIFGAPTKSPISLWLWLEAWWSKLTLGTTVDFPRRSQ